MRPYTLIFIRSELPKGEGIYSNRPLFQIAFSAARRELVLSAGYALQFGASFRSRWMRCEVLAEHRRIGRQLLKPLEQSERASARETRCHAQAEAQLVGFKFLFTRMRAPEEIDALLP